MALLDMEFYVNILINDSPVQTSHVVGVIDTHVKLKTDELTDSRLKTAMTFNTRKHRDEHNQWHRSALESKAIQDRTCNRC